jgi:type VI secretion system protein ImpJ
MTLMGASMKQLQKPLWTKGLLLTQQQMQMQDRFLEELVAFGRAATTFCPWGFSRLLLDPEALAAGSLRVIEAAGILPDGLAFSSPHADAAPPPKALEAHWHADSTTLDVHLALPEQRAGGHNVSLAAGDRGRRYSAEVVLRRDENTGLAEKPIQFARKNLRLLAADEPLDGHTLLPIARVQRSASGTFALDAGFVPPVLDITASDHLLSTTRRLVEVLSARSSALSGARRQRGAGLADFGAADIASFWLLYTVNTHLPGFRHLLEQRRGHPAVLFEAMLELAGALTTFSTSVDPRALPAYDHNDLGPRFAALDAIVQELLDTVVPEHHVTLPLREVEPSIHATAIDQDRYLAAPGIFLAVAADMKPDQLLRRAPQLLKVSAADHVHRLVRQALPGVTLHPVAQPPGALPMKLGYQYFQIDRTGEHWGHIMNARNLTVYAPGDMPAARFELVILLPPAH